MRFSLIVCKQKECNRFSLRSFFAYPLGRVVERSGTKRTSGLADLANLFLHDGILRFIILLS